MEPFDNLCAKKMDWTGSLWGKVKTNNKMTSNNKMKCPRKLPVTESLI
jgi:hypothetical protein